MKESNCKNPPVFRFTWPGRDESYICAIHAVKLKKVASALGLNLQLIKLTPDEMMRHECCQKESED